jgi:hypothetical protein
MNVRPKSFNTTKAPHHEFITITPELAAAFLEKNQGNRNMSERVVTAYARDMQNGRWRMTGDPIRFDNTGRLIDGQHRLEACVRSDVPFNTLVIYNLDPSDQDVIDHGKPRRAPDVLQLKGYSYPTQMAAVARIIVGVREGYRDWQKAACTPSEIIATIGRHPNLINSVARCHNKVAGVSVTHLTFIHYIATEFLKQEERADAFLNVFRTGVPDYAGCAAHVARERCLRHRNDKLRLRASPQLNMTIHAWNLFLNREGIKSIHVPKDNVPIKGLDITKL